MKRLDLYSKLGYTAEDMFNEFTDLCQNGGCSACPLHSDTQHAPCEFRFLMQDIEVKELKVWTDTDSCSVFVAGSDYDKKSLIEALTFKALNIKAHADPEIFVLAAGLIHDLLKEREKNAEN